MNDVIATMTITFTKEGEVKVNGPLENKVLCYGLLEGAKMAVKDFSPIPVVKDLSVLGTNGKQN